ncbi:MAG: alanine racemase [Candidatus Kaelpia aquatica]|nr:alanine racemase [Candidatus Kaelpia aquatica]
MQINLKNRISNRCWLEIDLNAIRSNAANLRKFLKSEVGIIAVVKSNAYEHGIRETAEALSELIDIFAVSSLSEASELKECGIDKPILFLSNPLGDEDISFIIEEGIMPAINSIEFLELFDEKARHLGVKIPVHIKIDTGMSRLGVGWEESDSLLKALLKSKHLDVQGCFTHFAHAEDIDFTRLQAERFQHSRDLLKEHGYSFVSHLANSSTTLRMPSLWYDLVRPGLILYGVYPDSGVKSRIKIAQAMSFKTRLIEIKTVKKGNSIGYCCTYKASSDMKIGIIPVGYSQGIPWSFSNRGSVLLRSKRVSILGRVSMDQTMVDLRDIEDAQIGDEVVITGKQGTEEIRIEELAELSNTIPYEVLCGLGKVKDRVYL